MFELKKEIKEYLVKTKHGLEVKIVPLPMSEQNKILAKNTKGRSSSKFSKDSKDQTIELADTNHFEQNVEVAQKSWQTWNWQDAGQSIACNANNIRWLFDFHYEYANEVLLDFDKMIKDENEKLQEEKKT